MSESAAGESRVNIIVVYRIRLAFKADVILIYRYFRMLLAENDQRKWILMKHITPMLAGTIAILSQFNRRVCWRYLNCFVRKEFSTDGDRTNARTAIASTLRRSGSYEPKNESTQLLSREKPSRLI